MLSEQIGHENLKLRAAFGRGKLLDGVQPVLRGVYHQAILTPTPTGIPRSAPVVAFGQTWCRRIGMLVGKREQARVVAAETGGGWNAEPGE